MRRYLATLTAAGLVVPAPALANHIDHTDVSYPSRGACEAAIASFSNGDREALPVRFPDLFSSTGEVASFLTRAFSCEYEDSDRSWYISDDRMEVLGSDWFLRRR